MKLTGIENAGMKGYLNASTHRCFQTVASCSRTRIYKSHDKLRWKSSQEIQKIVKEMGKQNH